MHYRRPIGNSLSLPYSFSMSKVCLLLLLAAALLAAGCGSAPPSGSRQFVPGQGWVPN